MKTYIAVFGCKPGETSVQVFKGTMTSRFMAQASFIAVLDSDTGEFTRHKDRYALRQGDVMTNEQVNDRINQFLACKPVLVEQLPAELDRFTRLQ